MPVVELVNGTRIVYDSTMSKTKLKKMLAPQLKELRKEMKHPRAYREKYQDIILDMHDKDVMYLDSIGYIERPKTKDGDDVK